MRIWPEAPTAPPEFRAEAELRVGILEQSVTTEPAPRAEAHWSNWLVAGGLVAVSIPAIALAAWTASTDGECVDSSAAGCAEQVRLGAVDIAGFVAGGLALVGAVIFAAGQPIQVEVSASGTGARLGVRGRF